MNNIRLPQARFSKGNPYFQVGPFLARPTGQDYAFAWTWELTRFNIDMRMGAVIHKLRTGPLWKVIWMSEFIRWFRGKTREIVSAVRESGSWIKPLLGVQTLPNSGAL